MARRKDKLNNRTKIGPWLLTNTVILSLYTVVVGLFLFRMYKNQFLAFRSLNHLLTGFLLAVALISLVLLFLKKAKLFTSIFLVLLTGLVGLGLYGMQSTVQVAEKLNQSATFSEQEMAIVVAADSPVKDIAELDSVQAPTANDQANIQELLADIQEKKQKNLTIEEVSSYQEAYENLLAGKTKAMVLNSAYSSLLELSHEDYAEKIKTIYSYKLKKQIAQEQPKASSNVMNIYISGIDTYGSISSVSRSDVNIIMTVNMDTHKILLTTTPRDAYVQIPDGGGNQFDKLTHAGIYGVETSMKTLENLYGITIDYYARINFTSFMSLIDAVGGVEVTNDQAFRAGGYEFPVGTISMNSEQALAFVRERYSLQAGDADRGRNQQKVIAAIVNKLASVQSITNISNIVTRLQDSIQTNMTLDTMMTLANKQLQTGQSFAVTSQAVTGTGSTGQLPSYAMPTAALYMLSLDETSVQTAKTAIQTISEGK